MGATASVQLWTWQQLAEHAEAAKQPPVVLAAIRRQKISAADALEMDREEVDKFKPPLKRLDKLKVLAAIGQLSAFTSRADKARARLAQLARDEFGGVSEMFCLPGLGDPEPGRTFRPGLDLRGRKQMSLAWFKRALEREKLHGKFPYEEQEMIFRAIHADATEMMFFSQTVLITELVDWLEKSDPKFQYVGADYVEPPELKAVTREAPRVDGDNLRAPQAEDSLGEGKFGTIVSKTMWEQTWCKKMKVALKRAATWAAGQAEDVAPAELFASQGRPNPFLLRMHGVASVGGQVNVIMELGRCSLADQMETGLYKGNRLEAVRAARDIWLGLEHLHTVLGTPHLALHPNNIVLARSSAKRASDDVASALLHARTGSGRLKLTDVAIEHCKLTDYGGGVAKAARRAKEGSHYAAPELTAVASEISLQVYHAARAQKLAKSQSWRRALHYRHLLAAPERCDAWSYGSVLLELLTGKAPWSDKEHDELVTEIGKGAPPPLTVQCLADPDQRISLTIPEYRAGCGDGAAAAAAARTKEFEDSVAAPELLELVADCLTVDPAKRPRFDNEEITERFDLLLLKAAVTAPTVVKGDLRETAKAASQLKLMKKLIDDEKQKDADAFRIAWEDCVRNADAATITQMNSVVAELDRMFKPTEARPVSKAPAEEPAEVVAEAPAPAAAVAEAPPPAAWEHFACHPDAACSLGVEEEDIDALVEDYAAREEAEEKGLPIPLEKAPRRVRGKVEARKGIVKQPAPFKTAEELVARAGEASAAFHAKLKPIIENAGGEYLKGPRKLPHRINDKARDDYKGEVGRVIDVERATGKFKDLESFGNALSEILDLANQGRGDFLVHRVKDRINKPIPGSGYRDVMMNVEIAGFVGELQLSLERLLEVKSSAHRIYNLTRALGGEGGLLYALGEIKPPEISLLKACESGDVDVVEQWLRHPDVEVDKAEKDWTPLQRACYNGHADVVRALLDKATVDLARDDTASTPLYLTCYSGHVDAAQLVLEKGADVERVGESGWTPLRRACYEGRVAAARLLLEHGAEVDRPGESGITPLYVVCEKGSVNVARLLLDHDAAVDRTNDNGETPLWIACRNGHVDVARLLLERHAEVDEDDKDGRSPLYAACGDANMRPHLDVVRLLLDKGADVNQARNDDTTALYIVCQNGYVDTARLLLENGAAVEQKDLHGTTPMAIAKSNGHAPIVELLEDHLLKMKHPLHAAARRGDAAEIVRLLDGDNDIDRDGVDDANQADEKGHTPLFLACQQGHREAAQALLQRRAKVDHADGQGRTLLFIASQGGEAGTARLLLEFGATVDGVDNKDRTPLFIACERGRITVTEVLLGNGAKVDHCTPQGRTPLYAACQQGRVGTARLCLDHGAAVDQKDKMGLTPLYNACFEGHASAAKLLLDRGADGHAVLNMEKNMRADFSEEIDVLLEEWANAGGAVASPGATFQIPV